VSGTSIELKRHEAYKLMGITAEQVMIAPHITPQLREIAKIVKREGQPRVTRRINDEHGTVMVEETSHQQLYGPGQDLVTSWPYYLKASSEDEARLVLGKWYLLPAPLRRVVSIESCCVAAGISPIRIVEVLMNCIRRLSQQSAFIIASVNLPRVVQKHIEMSLTDDGVSDRTNFLKSTGFIPSPKGSQTQINITQANASAPPPLPAPPPEQTIRNLNDRWNESKKLPPPTTEFIDVPAAPSEPVPVESESDDEQSQAAEDV
jgi:hypothetical protein